MRAGPRPHVHTSAASGAFAAEPMAPSDIQATFFNGQPFTASTPGGTQFKMIFTPNGKMGREPLAQSGYKNTGTWKLDAKGFCTGWQIGPRRPATPSSQAARINGRFKSAQPQLQPQLQCGPNSEVIVGRLQRPPQLIPFCYSTKRCSFDAGKDDC